MSREARDLRERRAKLWEDAKAILDRAEGEDRDLSSEEQQTFERIEADNRALRARIERLEQLEADGAELNDTAGRRTRASGGRILEGGSSREEDVNRAWRAWMMRNTEKGPNQEDLDACARVGLNPNANSLELRALSTDDTSAGGYTVPNEMMRSYHEALLYFANIRPIATVWRTETGATLPLPTEDDTTNTGEILGEGSGVTTTADPSFGIVNIGAHKYSSKAVLVSVELLQDSFIDMPSFLGRKLGMRIGRAQSAHFATGTGTGEPQGFVAVSGVGKAAAATNAVTFDEVIDTFHSVDVAWRPNASWRMHDLVAATIRKLKDSNGNYLWQQSVVAGEPDRLIGAPVGIDNNMESTLTTNKKIAVFGDFSTYYIRDAGPVVLARASERWIDTHQVGFLAFQRTDGKGASSSALKHLTTKTT